MTEEEEVLMRSCLALCARRLRHYETQHRNKMTDYLSMVERQTFGREADTDGHLATMAEGFMRVLPRVPLAESDRPARVSAPAVGDSDADTPA